MKKLSLAFIACSLMFSCTSEEEFSSPEESITKKSIINEGEGPYPANDLKVITPEEITVIYKNESHHLSLDNKGQLTTRTMKRSIMNKVNTAYKVQIDNQHTIYLFDSESEMNKFIEGKSYVNLELTGNTVQTRAVPANTTRSWIYEHFSYGGRQAWIDNAFYFPNLKYYGWHDVISSTITTNSTLRYYVLTFYEHEYARGRQFVRIVAPNTTLRTFNFAPLGFNDLTSSLGARYLD